MDEDKLIALAYNAQVETGNDAIVDDDVIGCISSHVDDILGEQMSLLFTGGIVAHFDRRYANCREWRNCCPA